MGLKGDKNTQLSNQVAEQFAESVNSMEGITLKKMFGGSGIFHDGKMFGLVDSKGNCFLKADDTTRDDFLSRGGEQHSRMPYYSIPGEVMDDREQLISWTRKAIKASK
ncbi:MAG: TfoX/Sxy family protein [Owenweeksia sp.]